MFISLFFVVKNFASGYKLFSNYNSDVTMVSLCVLLSLSNLKVQFVVKRKLVFIDNSISK